MKTRTLSMSFCASFQLHFSSGALFGRSAHCSVIPTMLPPPRLRNTVDPPVVTLMFVDFFSLFFMSLENDVLLLCELRIWCFCFQDGCGRGSPTQVVTFCSILLHSCATMQTLVLVTEDKLS